MSLATRFKDILDGGFGRRRRETVVEIARNVDDFEAQVRQLREINFIVISDSAQAKEMFDLHMTNGMRLARERLDSLRRMKDSEDGRFDLFAIAAHLDNLMLLVTIEAVSKVQHLMWQEVNQVIEALKSQTITKEELGARMSEIQNEFNSKLPNQEAIKNLNWVRNYLRKASKAGGSGA